MIEHALGEAFEAEGHRFVVKSEGSEGCKRCDFSTLIANNPFAFLCGNARCEERTRQDGQSVRFREVK
jgi:hypothetical protein